MRRRGEARHARPELVEDVLRLVQHGLGLGLRGGDHGREILQPRPHLLAQLEKPAQRADARQNRDQRQRGDRKSGPNRDHGLAPLPSQTLLSVAALRTLAPVAARANDMPDVCAKHVAATGDVLPRAYAQVVCQVCARSA